VLKERGIDLVSGGTDNHMMLADLTALDITGKAAEELLGRADITVNKNSVPFETRSPFITSGIRIGTAAITSRGMKADQAEAIANLIADLLTHPEDEARIEKVRGRVADLCRAYPVYACGDA
jgi:glycine hydroxymethyltransferase